MIPNTTVRMEGDSLVTDLPAEVVRRLGIAAGTELSWVEDGRGGYRVVPADEKTRAILEAHEQAIADYPGVFARLAE